MLRALGRGGELPPVLRAARPFHPGCRERESCCPRAVSSMVLFMPPEQGRGGNEGLQGGSAGAQRRLLNNTWPRPPSLSCPGSPSAAKMPKAEVKPKKVWSSLCGRRQAIACGHASDLPPRQQLTKCLRCPCARLPPFPDPHQEGRRQAQGGEEGQEGEGARQTQHGVTQAGHGVRCLISIDRDSCLSLQPRTPLDTFTVLSAPPGPQRPQACPGCLHVLLCGQARGGETRQGGGRWPPLCECSHTGWKKAMLISHAHRCDLHGSQETGLHVNQEVPA
jgi:hypothetical protein